MTTKGVVTVMNVDCGGWKTADVGCKKRRKRGLIWGFHGHRVHKLQRFANLSLLVTFCASGCKSEVAGSKLGNHTLSLPS